MPSLTPLQKNLFDMQTNRPTDPPKFEDTTPVEAQDQTPRFEDTEPLDEKKNPNQTGSQDSGGGSEASRPEQPGTLQIDQEMLRRSQEAMRDPAQDFDFGDKPQPKIGFGDDAVSPAVARRQQQDQKDYREKRAKELRETPLSEIQDHYKKAHSDYRILADSLKNESDSFKQNLEKLNAYQSLEYLTPEAQEDLNQTLREAMNQEERIPELVESALRAEEVANQAEVDRYIKRSETGTTIGAMQKSAVETTVDMGVQVLRMGAYVTSLFEGARNGMTQEQYMKTAEALLAPASEKAKIGMNLAAQWETGVPSIGTTEEFIAESTKEFGLDAGLITVSQSLPMMAGGYTTMFLGMAAEADKMIKQAPNSDQLSPNEKMAYSTMYGAVGGLLERVGLQAAVGVGAGGKFIRNITNTAIKRLSQEGKPITLNAVQRMALNLAQSGVAEGATEVGQESLAIGMEETVNTLKNEAIFDPNEWEDVLQRTGHAFKMGLNAGLIMGSPSAVVQGFNPYEFESADLNVPDGELPKVTPSDYQRARHATTEEGYEDIMEAIDRREKEGMISPQMAEKMRENTKAFVEMDAKMNQKMTMDQRMQAFPLLMEKQRLEKVIKTTDETLLGDEKQQLEEVNNKLKEIVAQPSGGTSPAKSSNAQEQQEAEIEKQRRAEIEEKIPLNEIPEKDRKRFTENPEQYLKDEIDRVNRELEINPEADLTPASFESELSEIQEINKKYDEKLSALRSQQQDDTQAEAQAETGTTLSKPSAPKPQLSRLLDLPETSTTQAIQSGDQQVGEITINRGKEQWPVRRIDVDPEAQGQGHATEALRQAHKEAQQNGAYLTSDVLHETPAAEAMWEKLVKQGEAVKMEDGRYRMNTTSDYNLEAAVEKKMSNVFPMETAKAKATAKIYAKTIEQMAKREGITTEEMLGKIQFQEAEKAPEGALKQETTGIFKSTAKEGIAAIQQKSATPEQWSKMIADKGGRGTSQELDWIGLNDFMQEWMRENNAKSVPKEVVEQYINDNQIEIVEISKGANEDTVESIDEQQESLRSEIEEHKTRFRDLTGFEISQDMDGSWNPIDPNDPQAIIDYDALSPEAQEALDNFQQAQEDLMFSDAQDFEESETRHGSWTLEGGENYREVLLTLPNNRKSDQKFYEKRHFREGNILAHLRINERTLPNGERVMFIEEVQSDWAQEGRKKGFDDKSQDLTPQYKRLDNGIDFWEIGDETQKGEVYFDPDRKDATVYTARAGNKMQDFDNKEDAIKWAQDNIPKQRGVIPDMPYKTTDQWVGMAMRRAMQMAAQEGFDRVAWVTGEQNAERYDLSKQVDYIDVSHSSTNDQIRIVNIQIANSNSTITLYVNNKSGMIEDVHAPDNAMEAKGKPLSDVVGKELAENIMSQDVAPNREAMDAALAKDQTYQELNRIEKSAEQKIDNGDGTFDEYFKAQEATQKYVDKNYDQFQSKTKRLSGQDLKVGGEGMKAFYNSILPKVAKKEAQRFDKKAKVEVVNFDEGKDYRLYASKASGFTIRGSRLLGSMNGELPIDQEIKRMAEKHGLSESDIELEYDGVYPRDPAQQLSIAITPEMRMNLNSAIPLFQGEQGAMLAKDGQYIVFALTDPNVSTPVHELAHIYEHYLTDQERQDILDSLGHDEWTTETSEAFARGFEKYLAEGKAPSPELQSAFENFKNWLIEIYNNIVGSDIDVELNDTMRSIYDQMLGAEAQTQGEITDETTSPPDIGSQEFESLTPEQQDEAYQQWQDYLDSQYGTATEDITIENVAHDVVSGNTLTPEQQQFYEQNQEGVDAAIELYGAQQERGREQMKREGAAEAIEVSILQNLPKITYESFKQAHDEINPSPAFRREYFDENGPSIDYTLEELTELLGQEVTTQDVVDAIVEAQMREQQSQPYTRKQMREAAKPADSKKAQQDIDRFKQAAEFIRSGKLDSGTIMSSLPGFTQAWNLALEAAAKSMEAAGSLHQKYKVFMEEFKKTDFWKGLTAKQQRDIDRKTRQALGVGPAKIRENEELRNARLRAIRLKEMLDANVDEQGNTLSQAKRDAMKSQLNKARKRVIEQAEAIGKNLPVENVTQVIEDVRMKMQEKITALRKELKSATDKLENREERLKAVEQVRKDLAKAIKDTMDKKSMVTRSIAASIAVANTPKKVEKVMDRIEKLMAKDADKANQAARTELIKDISNLLNPKNHVKKSSTSRLQKAKITEEARQQLTKILAEFPISRIETLSDEALISLHEFVGKVYEKGRVDQRDYINLLTATRRAAKDNFAKLLGQKFKKERPISSYEQAIERLENGDMVVVDGQVWSKQIIDDFKKLYEGQEVDGYFIDIPKVRVKKDRRMITWHAKTVNLLNQLYYFMSDTNSQEWIMRNIYYPLLAASKNKTVLKRTWQSKEQDLRKKIWGKSFIGRSQLLKRSGIDLKNKNGEIIQENLRNAEIIYLYQAFQQPDMLKKALSANYGEESIREIFEYVDSNKKLKAYSHGQMSLYQEFLPEVNKAMSTEGFQIIGSKPMPTLAQLKNQFKSNPDMANTYLDMMEKAYGEIPSEIPYAPMNVLGSEISRDQTSELFGKNAQDAASVISGNAIPRTDQGYLQISNVIDQFEKWTEGMANMTAKAASYRMMQSIFNEQNIAQINNQLGSGFAKELQATLNRILIGKRPQTLTKLERFFNRSAATTMFLNTASAIWQQFSKFNYAFFDNAFAQYAAVWITDAYRSKEYWQSRRKIANSKWLQERLKGNLMSIELREISQNRTKYSAIVDEILAKGYVLTKYSDFNAIVSGGTPYFMVMRRRYMKKNAGKYGKQELEERADQYAMDKLYERTQSVQQSSEEIHKSSEQSNPILRVTLAFNSVNLQYQRVVQEAARDLKNGRGNPVEHVARIIYFGAFQNLMFTFAARALSPYLMSDDDDDKKLKKALWTTANQTTNTFMIGMFGAAGGLAAVTKDMLFDWATGDWATELRRNPEQAAEFKKDAIEFLVESGGYDEKELKSKSEQGLIISLLRSVAPPLGIKLSNVAGVLRGTRSGDPIEATTNAIEGALNLPADQMLELYEQFADAMNEDYENSERVLRLFNLVKKYDIEKKYENSDEKLNELYQSGQYQPVQYDTQTYRSPNYK